MVSHVNLEQCQVDFFEKPDCISDIISATLVLLNE